MSPCAGAPEEMDVTIFSAADFPTADAGARALAADAKAKRSFTDVHGFTLRCLACQKGLVGEAGAKAHAAETGHSNFSEY